MLLIFLRLHVLGYIGIRIKFLEPVFCLSSKKKGEGGGGRVDERRWIFLQTSCLKTLKAMETRVCGGDDITCHNSINQNHVSIYTQKFYFRFIVQIMYRALTCKNLRQLPLDKYVSKM